MVIEIFEVSPIRHDIILSNNVIGRKMIRSDDYSNVFGYLNNSMHMVGQYHIFVQ